MKKKLLSLIPALFFVLSCLLPGMIPLTPLPDMETNNETVIEVLNGQDWVPLQALITEQYTEEDYSKPGVLTFTATVTNEQPVYFNYGWCTVDEETLRQNFEHIVVDMFINEDEIAGSNVHNLTFGRADGLVCLDFGVLLSNWEPGEYELKSVATFEQQINDGLADYDAGDYIFIYNVTVEE